MKNNGYFWVILKKVSTTKILIWVALAILLLPFIAFLLIYFLQDKIIFQYKKLSSDYVFRFESHPSQELFEEFSIKTEDGETLNALLFRTRLHSKGFILYFHGNADNLQRWGKYAVDFTKLGYDILMMDYRGYGKSTGKPSEHILYKDALTVLRWAEKTFTHSRFIIYGRSLGSAVASNLATVVNPDLLILETPFDELKGAVYEPIKPLVHFLPFRATFSNKTFLSKVNCRKVIIHGNRDQVVPLSSALRLKEVLKEEDQFIIIQGGSHRNLRDFKEFHRVLAEVLR